MIVGRDGGEVGGADHMGRLDDILAMAGEGLWERVGSGHITPAAYDTGWVARIPDPLGEPEFPEAMDWLVANQREDGSWGSEVFHEYDRFINTLSAAVALHQWGRHPEVVDRAEEYLRSRMGELGDAPEGVASDHLVGMLVEEARRVGLDIPHDQSPHQPMGTVRRALLSYVYIDPEHPLGHFVEVLGRGPSQRRVTSQLQAPDGSIMSSGSSTAASIVFEGEPVRDHTYYDKLRYIRAASVDGGGVRHFWDLDVMDRVYCLYNLMHSHSGEREWTEAALALQDAWMPTGLGFGRHFRVADLDDTAMGYRLLTMVGREPDPHVLDAFWRGDHFVTYAVESRGRPGPNVHALEAVAASSHPDRDAMVGATVKWLRSRMVDGTHLVDEWHLSPAYCTSHAIPAFHMIGEALLAERCASFFLDTQHPDGSWGFVLGNGLGTIEETAFGLQGLLYYHHEVERIDTVPIRRAAEYLLEGYPAARHPEMWMAKVLYAPGNIIDTLVLGALTMYRDWVGGGGRASPRGGGLRGASVPAVEEEWP